MRMRAIAAFILCAFCFAVSPASAREEKWEFVQSVGGMKLGEPRKTDVEWILPVEIDLTGLKTITVQPTLMNSSRSCMGIGAEYRDHHEIYLALFTGFATRGAQPTCPPISLGHPDPGKYAVFYQGRDDTPVKLAEITIQPE